MTAKDQAYVAEKMDRFQKFVAIGILVLAFSYTAEVFQYLVSGSTLEILKSVSFWLGILVILIILPQAIQFGYLRYKYRSFCIEIEGYVLDAVRKASVMSFSLTFCFMVFMDGFLLLNGEADLNVSTEYPARFYLKIILAFTLFIQSIAFFWFTRGGEGDDA